MALHPSAHLHLEWIKKNPNFVPDVPVRPEFKTYFDEMTNFWSWNMKICPDAVPMMANHWLKSDLRLVQSYETRLAEKKVELGLITNTLTWFCTLNYNHQTWTIEKCLKILNKILSYDWVFKCRAVFEYHREGGLHPHMHLLITTDVKYKKKVIEKLWAVKDIKKVISDVNFISVEPGQSHHDKYIMGDKKQDKLSYVAEDRLWREANNIPHLFQK